MKERERETSLRNNVHRVYGVYPLSIGTQNSKTKNSTKISTTKNSKQILPTRFNCRQLQRTANTTISSSPDTNERYPIKARSLRSS